MQLHFLPWSGYFNLISKSDRFIFKDKDILFYNPSLNSWGFFSNKY